MSAKLRLTLWFTLMVLILSIMVLVFVLVMNGDAMTDNPSKMLVKVVLDNAHDLEFEKGRFDWGEIDLHRKGVDCLVYDADGKVLLSGLNEDYAVDDIPLAPNLVRNAVINGIDHFVYDTYLDMQITSVWIRGIVPAADSSGTMHTIIVLTATMLPIILVLTLGGGWLIANNAFRPMEKILNAADSITDGGDLSARLALRKGPSEMKRLGHAFDRMFSRLEFSFNTERQFAADVSHELRTPITVILAECDRAKRKAKTPEDFMASISVIDEQGRSMSELVQQLLSLTRMQHGTDRYPMNVSDFSAFVESCCLEFLPADSRGIELSLDIKPGISIAFNPSLMSRVIHNLLQNAYKYGVDKGHIWLSLRQEKHHCVLSISDDGCGIARGDQDKIWQRFWQADVSRGEDGGSGLGLAMVKEIVEFHGGRVSVESEIGKGSRFIIKL